MPTATSVITPARYELGLTYADFLAGAAINHDKFDHYYRNSPLSEEDLAFFQRAAAATNGVARIVAIAEAWCGDVYRELPTIARIADHTGIDLRVFLRDENPDIMDEFLSNDGKARAIPVFIFYTAEMRYITHFTERSASAHAQLAALGAEVKAELNLPQTATYSSLPEADAQLFLKTLIPRILPRFPDWQKDTIQEIRQLLASALHLS
jgi:hypothetical protein